MTSQKQIEANRINAAKSTGPRTEEGKRVSSMNALRENAMSSAVLLKGECPARFGDLTESLKRKLNPGPAETYLVESMAVARWRYLRYLRMEAEACAMETDGSADRPAWLILLQRFQANAVRSYNRNLGTLHASRRAAGKQATKQTVKRQSCETIDPEGVVLPEDLY